MKNSWILALLSPVIAFSSYYYDDQEQECAHQEYVVVERLGVCAECGSVLGTVVDRREVASRDDQVERRTTPRRKGQPQMATHSRAHSIREKASSRPKVVQKEKRRDATAQEVPEKRERYASTTIGSLARKSKQKDNSEPTHSQSIKSKKQPSKPSQSRGRQELRGKKKV